MPFQITAVHSTREYEIQPRKDHRGVDLFSDVLPFGHLWYGNQRRSAMLSGYGEHRSRSRHAVIRVYDTAGNVIETHHQRGRIQRGGAQHLY
jgi:YD repeat-containing protein